MNFFNATILVSIGFVFALFVEIGSTFEITWFLFGLHFYVDFTAKIFLIFTTFVWLISALSSYENIKSNIKRYWFWFALAFIGNYGLILSYDALTFYLFFSLMSLASFGLVIHLQTPEANHAAFVYIKYAIFGEIILFVAIVLATSHYGGFGFELFVGAMKPLTFLLFLIGFGIKAGVLSLHFWLPLAHGNAPAPASALLSGVMLKAGVLGLIRYLPFAQESDVFAGAILCTLGVAGVYGGLYGVFKNKIKVVLAYSSISQMGYLITLLGVGLLYPRIWESAILPAILFFSLHHAINKSALFLLSGEVMKNGLHTHSIILGTIFALSLIGVNFTSGALAKEMLYFSLEKSPLLVAILTPSMIVTALLIFRVYWLSKNIPKKETKSFTIFYILYPVAFLSLGLFLIV